MIPAKLTVALVAALILFFVLVLYLLKYRRLALKYTLLWLVTGTAMLILVVWPGLLLKLAILVGIQSNMNALYIFMLAFVIMILMSLTSICSGQNARIRELIQTDAIMEKRLREAEKKIEELSGIISNDLEKN